MNIVMEMAGRVARGEISKEIAFDEVVARVEQASAALIGETGDNFSRRQAAYGLTPPTLSNAPDPDGRTGSYRRMVEGIDPRVPGNPGYADYYGLGHTAAADAQAARNAGLNMPGGAIARR